MASGIQYTFPMDGETKAVSAVEVRYRKAAPWGYLLLDAEKPLPTNGLAIREYDKNDSWLPIKWFTESEYDDQRPRSSNWTVVKHGIPFRKRIGNTLKSLGVVIATQEGEPIDNSGPNEGHDIPSVCIVFGIFVKHAGPVVIEGRDKSPE